MTDMQKRIKDALEKVTPGPWEYEKGLMERGDRRPAVITYYIPEHGEWFIHGDISSMEDAYLIANAPTWLLHQQELIEQLQGEMERRIIQADINISLGETVINMQAEIEQKDAEIKQLREALELIKYAPSSHSYSRAIADDVLSKLDESRK